MLATVFEYSGYALEVQHVLGLAIGLTFGAGLYLAGLANPDKIIGTLRLRDLHALRVIAVFILVGMLGTWVLSLAGQANFSVKPAYMLTAALGGALLGFGFGMTGYCPGTGLACAAAGRFDAIITVIGMLGGAMVYILIHPYAVAQMEQVWDLSQHKTLPAMTGTDPKYWVLPICGAAILLLWITKPRKRKASPAETESAGVPTFEPAELGESASASQQGS